MAKSPDRSAGAEAVMARFSPATREWFATAFAAPTAAQLGAWQAVADGDHTLVVAPTGSGKTLAAFGWAIDRLATSSLPPDAQRCRVLYISPLKALASDVERNLRAPLTGIMHAAQRIGADAASLSQIRAAIRTGDTPAAERRDIVKHPPDILITTPESLFLLLTSQARDILGSVETVICDEVHALTGTKRGAHLALSLERLDALLPKPSQRIGLSATVRPAETVAAWLRGHRDDAATRPIRIVQPPADKQWDLQVVVPVPDLGDLATSLKPITPENAAEPEAITPDPSESGSIWPHVSERIVDLIAAHHSTLVFANSRRLSERLTARLNELWQDRLGEPVTESVGVPAEMPGQSGIAAGAPAVLARAHHGSVSKEQRAIIEGELKAGRLPAVVATSSLELGIDMGAVDAVACVSCPPSVASGLQRIGRAGHQVGAVSRGVLFPTHRSDLVATAVLTQRMRDGQLESLAVPRNPLDVLAQQIIAMTAMDAWPVDDLLACIRRADPFATLSRPVFEAVLDMLAGRYPSDEFAELRPRIVWDRIEGTLAARPGAQRLAVTSGGTIPDRGLYGVFLAGEATGPGRRVGELDEEMVYESRIGDVFTLGSTSWRIEDITHDQVLVTPAPGQAGRLPFWHGENVGRPAELGAAIGAFTRTVAALPAAQARERTATAGLDEWASDNLLAYLAEQHQACAHLPSDTTLVVEKFRDELGDWRVVVHSPWGARVHAPWALLIAARLRERYGVDVQAMAGDDGIVLRLPDTDTDDGTPTDIANLIAIDPAEVIAGVRDEIGGSALFAARFRECAARALLLPRRNPGKRQPLWQQRQRAAHLLAVAVRYPQFPIVLEAVRECLHDVFDLDALATLLQQVAARQVNIVEITTPTPSPFARSLLFGYVAQYLYEGDAPLAERRSAALSLDPQLLSELLGGTEGATVADLLDPQAVMRVHAELQRLAPDRRLRGPEGVADLLRILGPLTTQQLAQRLHSDATAPETTLAAADNDATDNEFPDARESATIDESIVACYVAELQAARRIIAVRIAGVDRWAAVEDAGRLRDALGVTLPLGVAEAFTEPANDPLVDLVSRYARTHVPFTLQDISAHFGVGTAVMLPVVERLVSTNRLVTGALLPEQCRAELAAYSVGEATGEQILTTAAHPDYCDAEILRRLRRRSLAALRAEVEPVSGRDLARFLPGWHSIPEKLRGTEGLLQATEQLAGAVVPASALETLILPARVRDYSSAMLDELLTSNDICWTGHGALGADDGWIALYPQDICDVLLPERDEVTLSPGANAVTQFLSHGGGYFFDTIVTAVRQADATLEKESTPAAAATLTARDVAEALWELTWAGRITNDTLMPLRSRLGYGKTAHRTKPARPASRYRSRLAGLRSRAAIHRYTGSAGSTLPTGMPAHSVAGRWSLLPPPATDATLRAHARAEILLERHAIVTRGAVMAEGVPGGFGGVYRVLSAFEDAGHARRGYFIEKLGAAQFATPGAVDQLRAASRELENQVEAPYRTLVLAATDPANPYGAALAWPPRPESNGHRPGRKAGAVVVLVDGELVLYCERGGQSLLSWTDNPATLHAAAAALAAGVRRGALGALTITRADGTPLLGSATPLAQALLDNGFHPMSRGLRLR